MEDATPGHALVVALEGPGIKPATVDTKLILEAALAYVAALIATAEDIGYTLTCRGIEIRHASAGVRCLTDLPNEELVDALALAITSPKPPPYAKLVLAVAQRLPGETRIKIANDNHILGYVDAQSPQGARRARVSARVQIIRAGGSTPAIRVEHVLTGKRFTLATATEVQARELAQHLYQEIDIVAEVSKYQDGRWVNGQLLNWYPIPDVDPVAAWRDWFAPHAEHWSQFSDEDIRRELGRDE